MIGKTKIVGEIGIAHQGDRYEALQIIKHFRKNVDYYKVQIRTPRVCVPKHLWYKEREVRGKKMTYIEYKEQMELDWEKIFEEADIPENKWFASVWDLPALKRYMEMNRKSKIVKFPACFSFKPKIYDDFLDIIPEDWQVFMSLPIIENPQSILIYERLNKHYSHHIVPYLTFMTYNNPKFDMETIIEFRKNVGNGYAGYSSHFDKRYDKHIALALKYDFIEVHLQGNYETSDSKISTSSWDLSFIDIDSHKFYYSYNDVDWEKIQSLIPERWK